MKKDLKKIYGAPNCPVRNVLDRIGDKWSILVILLLGENDTLRFGELDKLIETISQKMLTVTLKTLEADGLIERKSFGSVPPESGIFTDYFREKYYPSCYAAGLLG